MTDDESDIANYKYHAATVVALSSGEVAVIGHFTNEDGLPLISTFATLEDLHKALWEFQTLHGSIERTYSPSILGELGLGEPLKRRSLNGS